MLLVNGPAQVTVAFVNIQTFVADIFVFQLEKISVAVLLIVNDDKENVSFVRRIETPAFVTTTSSPLVGTALSLQFEFKNQSLVPLVVIHVLVAADVDKGCTSARIAEDRTAQPTAILVVLIFYLLLSVIFHPLLILFQNLKKYIVIGQVSGVDKRLAIL
jgi:hypothetical protein